MCPEMQFFSLINHYTVLMLYDVSVFAVHFVFYAGTAVINKLWLSFYA